MTTDFHTLKQRQRSERDTHPEGLALRDHRALSWLNRAVQYEPMRNRSGMRQAVFEYIEVDCNRTRRHSALGYLSPLEYELSQSA